MAEISIQSIKDLRDKSGAGMMDCKKALVENGGDIEKALDWLREKGIATMLKKSGRIAAEGIVESYIHGGGRVGVLVEVNIETDFAARNEAFKGFVRDIALQIAAMNPRWVAREDVPAEELDREREVVRNQALNEGKPEKIVDRIVDGRIAKFYQENCLLDQDYIKDDSKTVQELLTEMTVKIGERIVIRRFTRYELGEGLERREEDFAAEVMSQIK
ncbi:MAG: translation elongation factor Ts [Bacillota bacterium]|nr:translation elongation factor Ts [Bacillota bacterium]